MTRGADEICCIALPAWLRLACSPGDGAARIGRPGRPQRRTGGQCHASGRRHRAGPRTANGPVPSAPPGPQHPGRLGPQRRRQGRVDGGGRLADQLTVVSQYLVDRRFVHGSITGKGSTKLGGGSLEAGYQIGCGIIQDDIESITGASITGGLRIPYPAGGTGLFPVTPRRSSPTDKDRPQARHGEHRPGGKKSFRARTRASPSPASASRSTGARASPSSAPTRR